MKWIKKEQMGAVSDCGLYEIRARYSTFAGFFWRGTHIPTGSIVAESADKEFVKCRCEAHALQPPSPPPERLNASADASQRMGEPCNT